MLKNTLFSLFFICGWLPLVWSQQERMPAENAACELPTATLKGFSIAGGTLRWPGEAIPYEVKITDFTTAERAQILSTIQYLNETSNVCLLPRTFEADYIELSLSLGDYNSASSVGYRGGVHRATFARNQARRMYLHEFCHLLGMIHEHQRPDRDKFVQILYYNIPGVFQPQFERYDSLPGSYYWSEEYDFNSVMHYAGNAFGRNGQPTIDPRDPAIEIRLEDELTELDIATLNRLYPRSLDCDSIYRNRILDGYLEFRDMQQEVCRNRTIELAFIPTQGDPADWTFNWEVPGGEIVRSEGSRAFVRLNELRTQRVRLRITRGAYVADYEDFIFVADPQPQLTLLGNPASSGQINYRFSSANESVSIWLMDATGRKIYTETLTVSECGAEGSISCADCVPGIYLLTLADGKERISRRVTIY